MKPYNLHVGFGFSYDLSRFVTAGNKERCGVIIGANTDDGDVVLDGIVEVVNRHEDPRDNYRILRGDVDVALKAPLDRAEVVGAFHTHNNGQPHGPTYLDVLGMRRTPGLAVGVVYHVHTRTLTFYNARGFISSTTWRM